MSSRSVLPFNSGLLVMYRFPPPQLILSEIKWSYSSEPSFYLLTGSKSGHTQHDQSSERLACSTRNIQHPNFKPFDHSPKPACVAITFSTSRSISLTAPFFCDLFPTPASCDSAAATHRSRYWPMICLSRGELGCALVMFPRWHDGRSSCWLLSFLPA